MTALNVRFNDRPAARPALTLHPGGCSAGDPRQNRLLAALPAAEWLSWRPQVEAVDMPQGQVLCEPGHRQRHVYFPTTSMVSLHNIMADGQLAQFAVVGSEGMVGISLLLGGETTTSSAVVEIAGKGFRLNAQALIQAFNRSGAVMHLLLRYVQALITQTAQAAVCNRHHSLEQRLCHWLLLSLDRLPSNDIVMTQERIAYMLGVRREGVTEAAGNLQKAGLIQRHRGHISVLDRLGLEQRACECYAVVRREYARLLPAETAT